MTWTKALPQEKLPEGGREVVEIGGRAILFIHHEGKIYAVENACPHMRLPLKGGKIEANVQAHAETQPHITCPWHHSAFDLETGDVKAWSVWPPAIGPLLGAITRKKALPVFPSKIEAGYVWVDLEQQDA
ncbi:MAG TPA: Rieske (2Fe-2S) protein [Chloroflexi bacterium]|nr:Rieske (2Fe-2S) protein [Chloroflexota bacterium]